MAYGLRNFALKKQLILFPEVVIMQPFSQNFLLDSTLFFNFSPLWRSIPLPLISRKLSHNYQKYKIAEYTVGHIALFQ